MDSEIEKLEKEKEILLDILQKKKEELDQVSASINSSKQVYEDLVVSVADGTATLDQLQSKLDGTHKEIELAESKLQSLENDASKTKKELETEVFAIDATIDVREEYKESLEKEIRNLENKKEALDIEVINLNETIDNKINDFNQQESKIVASIENKKKDIEMLKTIGFDINAELMTLVAKREDLESTIEKLTINKSELESKLTLVSDEHLVLTASVKTMNQTIEENKEEIAKLESQKQLLISEIESLKAENNSLIASKVAFVESKKALAQKEEHIKRIYQEAGVQFPI